MAAAATAAPAQSLKTTLFQAAEQLLMSKATYESLIQNLKAKQAEACPTAKVSAMQAELIKTHDAYKRVITESLANIESQYKIGQAFFTLLNETFKTENPDAAALQKVVTSLGELQVQLAPLLTQHAYLSSQITTLEKQIVTLIGPENAAAVSKK